MSSDECEKPGCSIEQPLPRTHKVEEVLRRASEWEGVDEKGSPVRIHKVVNLHHFTAYISPNGVGIAVLAKDASGKFLTACGGGKIQKNVPFIAIDGEEVSLPFASKLVECCDDGSRPYVCIFHVLK